MSQLPTQEEWDALVLKAQIVAADFIGYPVGEEDVKAIQNATPMQAIVALEKELQNRMRKP